MRPSEYVKKYNLNLGNKFDYNQFRKDLALDLIGLIEYFEAKAHEGELKPHLFYESLSQIEKKFNSLSTKTPYGIPESVWDYFLSDEAEAIKEEYFPTIAETENKIRYMKNSELVEYLNQNGVKNFYYSKWNFELGVTGSVRGMRENDINALYKQNEKRIFVVFALDVIFDRLEQKKQKEEAEYERQQAEWRQEWEKERQRRQKFYDFFNKMFSGFTISTPIEEFSILGLKETATEDEIKSAWRTLSLKHHPDKGGNHEMFVKITDAKNRCLAYAINNK